MLGKGIQLKIVEPRLLQTVSKSSIPNKISDASAEAALGVGSGSMGIDVTDATPLFKNLVNTWPISYAWRK